MRQLPAWDRIGNIKLVLGRLEQELDTGMAIIGHTYVEAYLAHALISHLFWSGVAVQAPWTARVFGGSRRGPHETLVANLSASRKAEWCRMEGLVDDEVLGDVELIRRVRNEFAHCVDYTLVEELPRKLLDQLEESDTRMLSSLDGETGLRGKLMNLILKSLSALELVPMLESRRRFPRMAADGCALGEQAYWQLSVLDAGNLARVHLEDCAVFKSALPGDLARVMSDVLRAAGLRSACDLLLLTGSNWMAEVTDHMGNHGKTFSASLDAWARRLIEGRPRDDDITPPKSE